MLCTGSDNIKTISIVEGYDSVCVSYDLIDKTKKEQMKKFIQLSVFALATLLVFSCKSKPEGEAAKVGDAAKVSAATGKSYAVNTTASKVLWEGAKVTGKHNGTISLSEGKVMVDGGKITGGEFVIDMNSINVLDLEGDSKASLEGHLKGSNDKNADDFFNVAKYPTAKFVISKVTGYEGEGANALVYGNLTLKDVTKQVSFKANVDVADSGIKVTTPSFTINRTDWGIKYGSASFFDGLKDKAINDDMGLNVTLVASAK